MVLVLILVWSELLVESVGQFFCPLWDNNPCPLWDNNHCPLWNTPPSVVIFLLNWLIWSMVRFWVKLWWYLWYVARLWGNHFGLSGFSIHFPLLINLLCSSGFPEEHKPYVPQFTEEHKIFFKKSLPILSASQLGSLQNRHTHIEVMTFHIYNNRTSHIIKWVITHVKHHKYATWQVSHVKHHKYAT
jgi:hypothetical protein